MPQKHDSQITIALNEYLADNCREWSAEQRLWAECLLDGFRLAIEEKLTKKYPKFIKARQSVYRDSRARSWLLSDAFYVGSFCWILSNLNILHAKQKFRDAFNAAEFAPETMGERYYRKWRYK
jgi:hypothetical protein